MFKILHKLNPGEPMSCSEIYNVKLIFLLKLFLSPHNYNNDNNVPQSSKIDPVQNSAQNQLREELVVLVSQKH